MRSGEPPRPSLSAGGALEDLMRERLGRACVYVPSCRLAVYLALRRWCALGGSVLMSPVNDDVMLFVVLAAGLRPVLAPVSPRDGNIDVRAVPESTWRSVDAVLTTNLYGMPDDAGGLRTRCDRMGIPLLEDAAHAIGTTVGDRPIGTFGTAAAFSLGKHAGATGGGFLAPEDPGDRKALEDLRDELLAPRQLRQDLAAALRPVARSAVQRLHLVRPVWRTMCALGLLEREHFRMELHERHLREAAGRRPDLMAFDRWVRVDLHGYRREHGRLLRHALRRRMSGLDADLSRRRAGTRLLGGTVWAAAGVRGAVAEGVEDRHVPPLFRVPLMVRDRDGLVARLERCGVVSGYVYDPPLDDFAGPEFVEPSPAPEAARWFAAHALPVDPLLARRMMRLLQREAPQPAEPLPASTLRDEAPGV
ncbi:DegT/DnrJ/EryC1/StrS family aminotransferase [Streptomyces sp. P17]|uniref:DegT/DnrJ/EryC1/StrS family aminotransferase n=2 Tax=Streptomyces TaxID=1883 RepID=UPI0028F430CD|nr:DegT/DnrJ/EryC1/StrS family aminotransferase [Streptomyces sp. P17]MDT9696621.1 DegT/DnrJ/EryC1/StrS family aminotransferase [Streptomyces sp. P17]